MPGQAGIFQNQKVIAKTSQSIQVNKAIHQISVFRVSSSSVGGKSLTDGIMGVTFNKYGKRLLHEGGDIDVVTDAEKPEIISNITTRFLNDLRQYLITYRHSSGACLLRRNGNASYRCSISRRGELFKNTYPAGLK